MNDQRHPPIELSPEGLRRRDRIGRDLAERARNRRTGRRAIAAMAMLALGATTIVAWRSLTPAPTVRPIVRTLPAPEPVPVPTPVPAHPDIQITVVTNSPIPDRPCSESAPPSPGTLPICVLDDTRLLQVLAETGQSYGIVKVAGRTEVVRNGP